MLGEFIEASINFSNADVWQIYAGMAVVFYAIAFIMYKSATNTDD